MEKNFSFDPLFEEKWKPSTYFSDDPYQLTEFEKILRTMVVKKPPPVKRCWRRTEHKDLDVALNQQDYLDDTDDPELCRSTQLEQTSAPSLGKVFQEPNTRRKKRKGKALVFKMEPEENTEGDPESEPEPEPDPEAELESEPELQTEPEPEPLQQYDMLEPCATSFRKPKKVQKRNMFLFPDPRFTEGLNHLELQHLSHNDIYSSLMERPANVANCWQQGNPWFKTTHRGKEGLEQHLGPDPYIHWYKARVQKIRMKRRVRLSRVERQAHEQFVDSHRGTVTSPTAQACSKVEMSKDRTFLSLQQEEMELSYRAPDEEQQESEQLRSLGKTTRKMTHKTLSPPRPNPSVPVQCAETSKRNVLIPENWKSTGKSVHQSVLSVQKDDLKVTCSKLFEKPKKALNPWREGNPWSRAENDDENLGLSLNRFKDKGQKKRMQKRMSPPKLEPLARVQSVESTEDSWQSPALVKAETPEVQTFILLQQNGLDQKCFSSTEKPKNLGNKENEPEPEPELYKSKVQKKRMQKRVSPPRPEPFTFVQSTKTLDKTDMFAVSPKTCQSVPLKAEKLEDQTVLRLQQDRLDDSLIEKPKKGLNPWREGNPWSRAANNDEQETESYVNRFKNKVQKKTMQKRASPARPEPTASVNSTGKTTSSPKTCSSPAIVEQSRCQWEQDKPCIMDEKVQESSRMKATFLNKRRRGRRDTTNRVRCPPI
ncbi:uncharacterized protein LOC107989655 [Cynoglossus semilaevis]|uniref:uncharacterized protein LOC107989655 n=1 Tax=Cynoglossus semilaevis TaxID=244447 RepID=UPI000D62B654|nr:uncharacterized protein LOC107989655 [Cynoglossus semilaevis]